MVRKINCISAMLIFSLVSIDLSLLYIFGVIDGVSHLPANNKAVSPDGEEEEDEMPNKKEMQGKLCSHFSCLVLNGLGSHALVICLAT